MALETFLSKGDALQHRGPLALFSSDLKLLKQEMAQSAVQLKSERLANIKLGRRPAYCPPAVAPLSSDEILTYFHSIPPVRRARMTTKDGFLALMISRYPCHP